MRIMARSVWNLLVFLLNSVVFMLIGLQMSSVLDGLGRYTPSQLAGVVGAVTAAAIVVRFAWVFAVARLPDALSGTLRDHQPRARSGELVIIGWCGMRGIVSLAAALSLPLTLADGTPFPHRDLLIFATFVVIVATLVGQGLTLPPLIRRLQVGSDWSLQDEQLGVRAAMSSAALAAIDEIVLAEGAPAQWADALKASIAERLVLVTSDGGDLSPRMDLVNRLRHAAIQAERRELIRLWRDNAIGDEAMHHLTEILDYQQAQLPRVVPGAAVPQADLATSPAKL
jgi:NhaP-type Na+/H+ or K+/H+ antiporter